MTEKEKMYVAELEAEVHYLEEDKAKLEEELNKLKVKSYVEDTHNMLREMLYGKDKE